MIFLSENLNGRRARDYVIRPLKSFMCSSKKQPKNLESNRCHFGHGRTKYWWTYRGNMKEVSISGQKDFSRYRSVVQDSHVLGEWGTVNVRTKFLAKCRTAFSVPVQVTPSSSTVYEVERNGGSLGLH